MKSLGPAILLVLILHQTSPAENLISVSMQKQLLVDELGYIDF